MIIRHYEDIQRRVQGNIRVAVCPIINGICPNSPIQQDLFDINSQQYNKLHRLDEVVDKINKVNGSETVVLGSQQYTNKGGKGKANVFADAIKHDFKSENPTTRWSDIIKLK
jgi:DNA polymerase V